MNIQNLFSNMQRASDEICLIAAVTVELRELGFVLKSKLRSVSFFLCGTWRQFAQL